MGMALWSSLGDSYPLAEFGKLAWATAMVQVCVYVSGKNQMILCFIVSKRHSVCVQYIISI